MITHRSELFAPSEHYQQAEIAEQRRAYMVPHDGSEMAPEIKEHLQSMLDAAANCTTLEVCRRLLQYCTGFIGHAVLTKTCTIEERKFYWNRIDQIRQSVADREYARNGK